MARIICNDCNKEFDEEELASYQECVGECFGTLYYETFQICPYCHSDNWDIEIEEYREE